MIIQQLRAKLADWTELLALEKTAAERAVREAITTVHNILVGIEGRVTIIEVDAAKEIRTIVAAARGETDTLVQKLDAAIGVTETAATNLKKAVEAQQKLPLTAATPPPTPTDAPSPAVDVTQSAPAAAAEAPAPAAP